MLKNIRKVLASEGLLVLAAEKKERGPHIPEHYKNVASDSGGSGTEYYHDPKTDSLVVVQGGRHGPQDTPKVFHFPKVKAGEAKAKANELKKKLKDQRVKNKDLYKKEKGRTHADVKYDSHVLEEAGGKFLGNLGKKYDKVWAIDPVEGKPTDEDKRKFVDLHKTDLSEVKGHGEGNRSFKDYLSEARDKGEQPHLSQKEWEARYKKG